MTPFEPASLLTAWTPTPFGLALVVLTAGWYLWLLGRARHEGLAWAWWRVALYLVLGVGTLAYAIIGPLATYRSNLFWVGALQVGTLASLTPVGLALGDPVTLLRQLHPDRQHWAVRLLEGRVARMLMFPAVSTVLAVCTVLVVFYTPVFAASTRSALVEAVLDVVLVVTGLLFVLPLLVGDLLPGWATPAVRTLLSFVDGLLDAVPGILLMTASTVVVPNFPGFAGRTGQPDPLTDTHLGGGALIAVAESVGLPVIAAVFLEWMRSDEREARATDAQLDADAQRATSTHVPAHTQSHAALEAEGGSPTGVPEPSAVQSSGLWWETDPRLANRFRRPPE